MTGLRELQHNFLNYLLEKPARITNEIVSDEHASSQQRLGFYADGYRLRLKEAIATDYEQLNAYLGEDLFDQLMDQYINQYQSQHPSLRYYSQYMPELLATKEPWSESPELSELATIEKSFCDSFDSADRKPVGVNMLAQIDPDHWPTLQLKFQDSVTLLPLNYNSFLIWQALSEEEVPPAAVSDVTTWLIWRSELISSYSILSQAETCAIKTMQAGGDFSALCENLLAYYDEQETPQQAISLLQGWLANNMVSELGPFA